MGAQGAKIFGTKLKEKALTEHLLQYQCIVKPAFAYFSSVQSLSHVQLFAIP